MGVVVPVALVQGTHRRVVLGAVADPSRGEMTTAIVRIPPGDLLAPPLSGRLIDPEMSAHHDPSQIRNDEAGLRVNIAGMNPSTSLG